MGPDKVEKLLLRAQQAIAERDWEKAKQVYLLALGLRSDLVDVHYGLATVYFQLRELTSAAHHFREVTRLDPHRSGAFINLGAVLNVLEQFDEAVTALRRGIQLDHNRAEGYYNLGLVHRRLGQLDLAIQAYQQAVRLNPRMADAHYNLANLYLEKGNMKLAISHYEHALEIRPGWEKAEHGLEQAEAALQPEEAPDTSRSRRTDDALPVSGSQLDPERNIDPNLHGPLLTNLHKATIESENHGRTFLNVLEKEIEPAIKVLSSCLLYPSSSVGELDQCVQRVEAAIASMRNIQRALQGGMDRVRGTGEKLLRS
jgi:Flp pilus assembly protein TadD